LRGPGSTAFSELLGIEGVSNALLIKVDARLTMLSTRYKLKTTKKLGLLFKNTKEVDAIIDKKLPGRPHFQHHPVMVGSEVCDVFYCDVIECIRSLFGDPNFTPYLCFAPEKHYTDDTKDT
jgi:hypothetical protein